MTYTQHTTDTSASSAIDELCRAYDAQVKSFLSEKNILAIILKDCVMEFTDCSLKDIAEKYIISCPQINRIAVDKDIRTRSESGQDEDHSQFSEQGKVQALSNEDTSVYEGPITFDIRFLATVPHENPPEDKEIRLMINLEAQNDFYPGYPIQKRGIYYGSRMISSQKNTYFKGDDYGKIIKVYSIWVCYDVPKKMNNTIVCYEITERFIAGHPELASAPVSDYDLESVVLIGLGDPDQPDIPASLRMLGISLSEKIDANTKKKILEHEFHIPMTRVIEEKVVNMCNLSKGIEDRGRREGRLEGRREGKLEGRREGKLEGRREGELNIIHTFFSNGGTEEMAKKLMNASDEQIEAAKRM